MICRPHHDSFTKGYADWAHDRSAGQIPFRECSVAALDAQVLSDKDDGISVDKLTDICRAQIENVLWKLK